jgi:hypothetical protein
MGRDTRAKYAVIPDMDAAILKMLPKQGSKLGLKPLGKQVKSMARELKDEGLTSANIAGRMGVLQHLGYAVKVVVQPVGNGAGWQITPEGEQFVARVDNGEVE